MSQKTTSNNLAALGVDELEEEFWRACEDFWGFSAASDMWWMVTARCGHGKFRGVSAGSVGFRSALLMACEAFGEAHRGVEETDTP